MDNINIHNVEKIKVKSNILQNEVAVKKFTIFKNNGRKFEINLFFEGGKND